MSQGNQFQTSLYFKKALYEVKAIGLQLIFNIFRQLSTWHTIKSNCIKLQTIDPEICSILIFQKRVWEQFLHHVLCMIFQEKCLSCYILLPDQISLPDCNCDVINFETKFIFLIKPFFYMTKKSRQKFRYLENIIFKGLLNAKIVSDLRVRL